jgi:transposase-like protein
MAEFTDLKFPTTSFDSFKGIEMAAPNGGKCPHCKDGYLYWNREGSHGKQYYKCGKCGSEVLA